MSRITKKVNFFQTSIKHVGFIHWFSCVYFFPSMNVSFSPDGQSPAFPRYRLHSLHKNIIDQLIREDLTAKITHLDKKIQLEKTIFNKYSTTKKL